MSRITHDLLDGSLFTKDELLAALELFSANRRQEIVAIIAAGADNMYSHAIGRSYDEIVGLRPLLSSTTRRSPRQHAPFPAAALLHGV